MATDPISGARYALETDSGDVALWLQRGVNDLSTQVVPRFTTTTTRDNAYSAAITAGTIASIPNGAECVANGVAYRRINGTWRIDRDRIIQRTTYPGTTISSGGANETGVTAGIAALASFTLYEASTVMVNATFTAGSVSGAALCAVKIDGTQVGELGVTRSDSSTAVVGIVALAAGSHTIAANVSATGASIVWTSARIVVSEGIAE